MKKLVLCLSVVWSVGMLLVPQYSQAVVTEPVISKIDQNKPFRVKLLEDSDDANAVKKQLGIYIIGKDSREKLIYNTGVLPHRMSGAVLSQLDIARKDNRYGMVTIADGKLLFFHLNTNSADPETFALLGNEKTPVLDFVTRKPIKLPELNSAEDVSIFQGPVENVNGASGQMLVISMRSPTVTPLGDGVTMALFVKQGADSEAKNLEFTTAPVVLDYRFHTQDTLSAFASANSSNVLPIQWALSLSHEDGDEPEPVKKWKQHLQSNVMKFMALDSKKLSERDHETSTLLQELPFYNLVTGKRGLTSVPQVQLQVSSAKYVLSQTYDPFATPKLSLIERNGFDEKRPVFLSMPGQLDRNADGSYRVFHAQAVTHTDLFFFEGDLMALFLPLAESSSHLKTFATKPRLLKLQEDVGSKIEKLAFQSMPVALIANGKNKEPLEQLYLLVSVKEKKGEEYTKVFLIDNKASEVSPRVVRSYLVSREFYSSEELRARFVEQHVEGAYDHVFFDSHARPSEDAQYSESEHENDLYMDLVASAENAPVYRHRNLVPVQGFSLSAELAQSTLIYHFKTNASAPDMFFSRRPSISGRIPDEVNFFVHSKPADPLKPKAEDRIYYVFFSERYGASDSKDYKAFTTVITVPGKERDGKIVSINKQSVVVLKLADAFYGDRELGTRVTLGEDESLLFDDVTPPQSSLNEYQRLYDRAGIHVDVVQSIRSGKLEKRLREPISTVSLGTQLDFKTYGIDNKPQAPSGVYRVVETKNEETGPKFQSVLLETFQPLMHVEPGLRTGASGDAVLSKLYRVPLKHGAVDLALMAVDASFSNGERTFQLLIALADTNKGADPVLLSMPFNFPLERMRWATLRQGKDENSDKVALVMGLADKLTVEGAVIEPGKITVWPLSITPTVTSNQKDAKVTKFTLEHKSGHVIKKESMKSTDFEALIREDAKGMPYVVRTLELNAADMAFEVQNLFDGTVVRPNSPSETNKFKNLFTGSEGYYAKGQAWRIRSQGQSDREEIRALKSQETSQFRQEVFPTVTETLASLATYSESAKHQVLVVDKALKKYILDLILARFIDERGGNNSWSYQNPRTALFLFDGKKKEKETQENILEQLEGIRDAGGRPVLMADLAEVSKVSRPIYQPDKGGFQLQEFSAPPVEGEEDVPAPVTLRNGVKSTRNVSSGFGDNVSIETSAFAPHLMYMFATEGDRVPLNQFQSAMAKKRNQVAMLFVGTQEEVDQVFHEASAEARYGLKESFHIEKLASPPTSTRTDLLKTAFDKKEIKEQGFRFSAQGLGSDSDKLSDIEARNKLLEYLVKKAERYATDEGKDVFSAFMKVMNRLQGAIIRDNELKKTRVVDRNFIDRFLTRIFNIPLQLNTLPSNDPLVLLNSPKAVTTWQRAGYTGPFELKHEIIRQILKQVKKDPVVKVPSSIMLFGDSRTGKTFLFESLVSMLGLKMYKFNGTADENKDAQAIILPMEKVISMAQDDGSYQYRTRRGPLRGDDGAGNMSLARMLEHLNKFLALPNGGRGWILFDDMHLLGDEDLQQLTNFQRGLLHKEYFKAQDPDTENESEIPTQHLVVFATFNPTNDVEAIRKIDPNYYPWNPVPVDPLVLAKATLNREKCKIEDSYFNRWGRFQNLSKFPMEAKGPKLIETFFTSVKDSLENSGQFFMIAPKAVDKMVTQFKGVNAKDFLSTANSTLIEYLESSIDSGKPGVRILIPNKKVSSPAVPFPPDDGTVETYPRHTNSLQAKEDVTKTMPAFVQSEMRAVSLGKDYEGQLELLRLMLDNFRSQVLEGFVEELGQSESFAIDQESQKLMLAPALRALGRHILMKDTLPLKELKLDPYDFGIRRDVDRRGFSQALNDIAQEEEKDFFPFEFESGSSLVGVLDALSDHNKHVHFKQGTVQFLQEKVNQVSDILLTILQARLKVRSMEDMPEPSEWLKALGENRPDDSKAVLQAANRKLVDVLDKFIFEIQDPNILKSESTGRGQTGIMNYEAVRLFALVMDKAIARLPWASTLIFTRDALVTLTQDMNTAQSIGVLNYFYGEKDKSDRKGQTKDHPPLVQAVSKEFLMQMILSSPSMKILEDKEEEFLHGKFGKLCANILTENKGK